MGHGCMEVTLELSCCKFPPADELQQFWEDNRKSLLTFLGEAHRGVKGFVKDETFTPIEGASMKVRGRDVEESESQPSGLFSFNPLAGVSNLLSKLPIVG